MSLICVGAFPGVERFVSLSQLTEAQLAKLDGTGDAVTTELCAAATDAWNAFRAPDPTQILRHLTRIPNLYPLRFLGGALKRFVEEFPSLANGLSRTESLVLHLLSEGPMHGGALFVSSQDHEMRPFMGDAAFYRVLHRLASARVPLVTIDAAADQLDLRQREVTVTDSGLQVLAGLADHVALNGLDLWRGGVHLIGSDRSPWRWDTRGERLVS